MPNGSTPTVGGKFSLEVAGFSIATRPRPLRATEAPKSPTREISHEQYGRTAQTRSGAREPDALEEMGSLPERDGSGEPSARTTATTATPGTSSPTTTPARAPIAGAKTVLAGSRTTKQRLCFALALWNGKDPILKERLFGLTNSEGNHGEDVKEYYFYLDSTPTHSYMKYLYKYPQAAFPYADLVETNRRPQPQRVRIRAARHRRVRRQNRYFDVFVEYAKESPEDILIQITAATADPDEAELHVLPTLWFRNDWATWMSAARREAVARQIDAPAGTPARLPLRAPDARRVPPCTAKATCRCSSPRTRPTTRDSSSTTPTSART